MRAIIMAGGVGTRLKPLTNEIPKPMIPIIDKPVMEYILKLLKKHNITDIAVTVGYKAEKIMEYFGNGNRFGVDINYFVEKEPLGTAGSVRGALNFIQDEVVIISGDAYTNINLDELIHAHREKNARVTIAVTRVNNAMGYGLVKVDEKGQIVKFIEKPTTPIAGLVNTGIYVINRELVKNFREGFLDFGMDVFPNLKSGLYAHTTNCYWSDIGTLGSYYLTNHYVATKELSLSN